jgi:predicted nucleotidyltransferase
MTDLIDRHRNAIGELCRRFGVDRLYVFGSAAAGEFRPSSDVDLVVCMTDRAPTGAYADRFLDLADALEHLFGRRVDLVSEQAMKNPFFRRQVEATRQLVYERSLEEAPV